MGAEGHQSIYRWADTPFNVVFADARVLGSLLERYEEAIVTGRNEAWRNAVAATADLFATPIVWHTEVSP